MKKQRWLRRKDERAPEILDAALACFAEKGFAACRMEDIAGRAGISKGTIYLYFESKEAVFKALAQRAIGKRIAAIAGQLAGFGGSTPELLRMVLTMVGSIASVSDAVVLPRLVLAEAGNFPELAEFWRHEIIDHGLGLFEAIMRRGQGRGEFRPMPPEHAARLCVAPLLVIMMWRSVFGRFDTEPYDYQGLVEAHIETLLRGLSTEAAK
jgi:AcrR family transcriptional regulator